MEIGLEIRKIFMNISWTQYEYANKWVDVILTISIQFVYRNDTIYQNIIMLAIRK